MRKNACALGSLVLLLSLLVVFPAPHLAQGAMYKYVDKNGTVIFTDCYECIPQPYRNQVQKIREVEPPPASREAGKEAAPEEGRKAVNPEPRKAEGERAAEGSHGTEGQGKKKSAALREKEERLEALRTRLQAVMQEKAGLRTNWMVFDRIRTNQLNQEIESIQKEMEALQAEIQEGQP